MASPPHCEYILALECALETNGNHLDDDASDRPGTQYVSILVQQTIS
jgi:hypothetical protein